MMISFFLHCTLLAAIVLLSTFSCIIKADPPTDPAAAPALSFCSELSSPSTMPQAQMSFTWPDKEDPARTLTLFNRSSLSLHDEDQSLSFTITYTNSADEDDHRAPSLAFFFMKFPPSATSPNFIQYMEVSLSCNKLEPCKLDPKTLPLPPSISDSCGVEPRPTPPIPTSTYSCFPQPNSSLSNQTQVSITYDADAATIQVQEVIISRNDLTSSCTFNFTLDAPDSAISNETTTLLVGSITNGEVIISDISSHTDENSESKHQHVVVWVIVGVSMMAILTGLLILVLFITKRCRGRSSIVSSHPAGQRVPPSAPSRAPFPYHDLESSPTPMMRALPLSPPYDTKEFQISGTASWLKQPNPR